MNEREVTRGSHNEHTQVFQEARLEERERQVCRWGKILSQEIFGEGKLGGLKKQMD